MSVSVNHHRPGDNAVRLSGALIGLAVFCVGIGMLWAVFQTAKTLFDTPAAPLVLTSPAASSVSPSVTSPPKTVQAVPTKSTPTSSPSPSPAPDQMAMAVSGISNSLIGFGRQWLLLLLMCIAGSFIASRGIELFFRACAASMVPATKVHAVPPHQTTS